MTNQTHDPRLASWVSTAQSTDTDFPIQNLPFGVFRRASAPRRARVGVAIGDEVLDLSAALAEDLLDSSLGAARDACGEPPLNALMSLGRPAARALRQQVSLLLRQNDRTAPASKAVRARSFVPTTRC